MTPLLFGTLVLHAERQVPLIDLPVLRGLPRMTGQHIKGRYNGKWTEINAVEPLEIYLPQRYKHLTLSTTNETTKQPLASGLEELDSLFPDARQLYKLNHLLDTIAYPFAASVNISSAVREGDPVSGSFYLLSRTIPLYFALVFDIDENSVQLMWSTYDFKTDIQTRSLFRYVFFAFTPIVNRPVFLHSQNLCARWWNFIKGFGEGRHGLLRASNALEMLLYKDPTIETYEGKRE